MPNTKSAAKALRQDKTRYIRNRAVKQRIKRWFKRFVEAIEKKDKERGIKIFHRLTKLYDKAAKRHIIHANKANRKKSVLQRKINAL